MLKQSRRHSKPPLAAPATSCKTRSTEGQDVLLEHSQRNGNLGAVRTNNAIEERRLSENSEESPQGSRAGYGDDSSVSGSVKLSYYGTKDHQRHGPRGTGLREWKGDFVGKPEREIGKLGADEVINGGGLVRIPQSKRRQGKADNRPPSEPRTRMPTMALERKPKESSGKASCESIVKHNKRAFLAPSVQQEASVGCERFYRLMRLLDEKAIGSRTREEVAEGLAGKSQRRLVEGIDLATSDAACLKRSRKSSSRDNGGKGKEMALLATIPHSPRMGKFRGRHLFGMQESNPGGADSSSCKSLCAAASDCSPSTSPNFLPLSHYIQKLRSFSPDSLLGASNVEPLMSVNNAVGSGADRHEHHEKFTCEDIRAMSVSHDREHGVGLCSTTSPCESASAVFSPASTNPSSPRVLPRSSPQLMNNRFGLSSSSALFASLAHPTELGTSQAKLSQSNSDNIAFGSGFESNTIARQDKSHHMITTLSDQLSYPPFLSDLQAKVSSEVMDETMNNVQRALGELKGSVQCMKVWLDADGQGWREHLDRLEKELENLKDKSDDEIIAAKHSLRNEMKVKLGDLMAEMERIRRQERDEVEVMVEEMVEKMLQSQVYTKSSVEMKDEIHLSYRTSLFLIQIHHCEVQEAKLKT